MPVLLAAIEFHPLVILLIGIILVVLAITVLRLHPFFALILSAVVVGILSHPDSVPSEGQSHLVAAVELPLKEFGRVAGSIGFVIALAAVIGLCLTESGAADKIVLRSVAFFGERNAPIALLLSSFVLAVPVFFDTVFFLLIPLARALARRTGKDYLLFVLAISGGGVITHSLVAPTPGPLAMADELKIDLGVSILGGAAAGLLPAVFAIFVARWLNRRVTVALPGTGSDAAAAKALDPAREDSLPPLWLALLPVVLPVILVGTASIVIKLIPDIDPGSVIYRMVEFTGNKNMALLLGTIVALAIVVRQKGPDRKGIEEMIGKALEMAGIIILITAAGGAFGAMIRYSGISVSLASLAEEGKMNLLILAWLVAAVMKIAQGSGTVSMITTSALMAGILGDVELGYHKIYIFMAIGFGSLFISWMNDSGFWVVGRMSGFTERQTLKSWTVLLAAIAVFGLVQTLILSRLLPFA